MRNEFINGGSQPRKLARQTFYGGASSSINEARRALAPESLNRAGQTPDGIEASSLKRLLTNRLLNALPSDDFERLLPSLEPVALSVRDNLDDGEGRYIYFPEDAVVSHLVSFEDGSTVEAAMTGREGFVGFNSLLGQHMPTHWPRITLPGNALRMKTEAFKQEFTGGEAFRSLLLEQVGQHAAQIAQRAACISRHKMENRFAVWLLMLHDRTGASELPLTHEFIAGRLGTRRAGISEVAGRFQEQGLISYSRGAVRILDLDPLERAACECYHLLSEH